MMAAGDGKSVELIRNVEEQIRSVAEQIREVQGKINRVKEQIDRVEEQINKVEEQIDRVEEQINRCAGEEEKRLLYGKNAQLRDEELQLRDKKAQLRDEELQLRDEKLQLGDEELQLLRKKAQLREEDAEIQQGRDGPICTAFDWLRQELPSWPRRSCRRSSNTPSGTRKERMHTPVKLEFWDVVKCIEDFLNKADKLERKHLKLGSSVQFALNVPLPVPPEPSARGEDLRTEDRDVQKCLLFAKQPCLDILVHSNGKGVAAFEVTSGGLGCAVPIHRLWERCSCRTEIKSKCWCNSGIPEGRARSILNGFLQAYEHMVLAKVGYGVLTDLQNWYLLKRDHSGCLYISEGFKRDGRQPPVLAALAYLVNSGIGACGEFGVSPINGRRPWSLEDSPKDDEDGNSTYQPIVLWDDFKSSPPRTGGACFDTRQNQLQEIPASDLHLDDYPMSTGGWSGCVVGGTLNGRRVAVKSAPCKSERAEVLLNEVGAYLKLHEHWGVFVPALVGYGTTADGRVVFIATELIDGSPLRPGTVTEEVASAALEALGAVHAGNLLHGDVAERNIMVAWGGQPSVRLIDFGFAKPESASTKSRTAEMRELQDLLQNIMKDAGFFPVSNE